ncbi:hypothetical protein HDU76_013753 [Blyttiomyces sp. JEL0837]|nr:hypothetical protein HDU76_013753 [Blyttiomyces sp. JEL0837]
MDLAIKSGSLRLVRYLKAKFTDFKVTIDGLCEVMEAVRSHGAKVQMVDFLLTNCEDCLTVEKVYSGNWKERVAITSNIPIFNISIIMGQNPAEIITHIINSSDFLTQLLNNNLSEIEIQQHATEIWNEAFKQDWSGDLTLLPSSGFPTATTGLCHVHSKSMLNRLRLLRPDLDINTPGLLQDTFQITIKDSPDFGWFPDDGAPVVALDFNDKIEPGGPPLVIDGLKEEQTLDLLSTALIHISMRNCWVEDLDPYVNDNPTSMVKLAINNDHFDLLKYLVDTAQLVDLGMFPLTGSDFKPYIQIAFNKNLEMFMYVHEKGCRTGDDVDRKTLLMHLIDMGQVKFLQYMHGSGMLSEDEFISVLSSPNEIVKDIDFWEWLLDTLCEEQFEKCQWAPIARDIKSAKRIVAKQHRSYPNQLTFPSDLHQLEANVAFSRLINLRDIRVWRHCSVDAYRRVHENIQFPNCHDYGIEEAVVYGNLELLKAIHEVCKCPSLKFRKRDVETAAIHGKLNLVKFFHENQLGEWSEFTFGDCTMRGDLELVKFCFENRRDDCSLDEGLACALQSGRLDVIKYLVGQGGKVDSQPLCECIENGHFHAVKYLFEDLGVECPLEALDLAVRSGSLKLVRYLWERYPHLTVGMDSLDELVQNSEKNGPKVQIVDFVLTNVANGLEVDRIAWWIESWSGCDERVVKYLLENEEKVQRVLAR